MKMWTGAGLKIIGAGKSDIKEIVEDEKGMMTR